MFSQAAPSVYQTAKCHLTYGSMGHVDPKQLPRRGKPWSSLMTLDYIHKLDLVLPQESYEGLRDTIVTNASHPRHHKVVLKLEQILQGEFFSEYVKKGDILMVSEGKTTISNMFTLKQGTLTMYLDKETYERAGLTGKPHGAKGNRGLKPRWIVNIDLRSDSMSHGKKGFDRILYACKNVLNQQLTWLFCNVAESAPAPDPLEKLFATGFTSVPSVTQDIESQSPALTVPPEVLANGDRPELEYIGTEWYEWLSLVRLGSPRVQLGDDIDPYLSRYQAPEGWTGETKLCKVSWQGFISPDNARKILADIIINAPSKSWFSFSATAFSTGVSSSSDEVTVLRPADAETGEYLMWEVRNSNS